MAGLLAAPARPGRPDQPLELRDVSTTGVKGRTNPWARGYPWSTLTRPPGQEASLPAGWPAGPADSRPRGPKNKMETDSPPFSPSWTDPGKTL